MGGESLDFYASARVATHDPPTVFNPWLVAICAGAFNERQPTGTWDHPIWGVLKNMVIPQIIQYQQFILITNKPSI